MVCQSIHHRKQTLEKTETTTKKRKPNGHWETLDTQVQERRQTKQPEAKKKKK